MISFKNKKILITGATGGIGNELVKKFLNLEGDIVATGTKVEKLDIIKKKYPSVFLMYEGQAQQQAETINSMITGFIVAMMVIFLVLTLQFKSYIQPFIIMAIMPFALIGVIWGHYFLMIPITLFSLCGIVALMGVVINDSIVLVDFINKRYERGGDIVEVLLEAGRDRFRPVALTSITTGPVGTLDTIYKIVPAD